MGARLSSKATNEFMQGWGWVGHQATYRMYLRVSHARTVADDQPPLVSSDPLDGPLLG